MLHEFHLFFVFESLPPANEVCEGYVFTAVCECLSRGGVSVQGGLCMGGSLSRGCLCPAGSLFRGCCVQGVSIQGRGSLSRGVSIRVGGGSLSSRASVREIPTARLRAGGTHPTGMHSYYTLKVCAKQLKVICVHLFSHGKHSSGLKCYIKCQLWVVGTNCCSGSKLNVKNY